MTITAALNFIMIYSNIYFKNKLLNKLQIFTKNLVDVFWKILLCLLKRINLRWSKKSRSILLDTLDYLLNRELLHFSSYIELVVLLCMYEDIFGLKKFYQNKTFKRNCVSSSAGK
jgi:hypothetical protein